MDTVAVKAIVTAVNEQYIKKLRKEYIGYKTQTFKSMIVQLRTWFVITHTEKIAIKAHFHDLWSDTPEAHTTTFARQLNHHQSDG